MSASPAPDRLAFLHIPKTAGTSLTQALARHWGRVRIVGRWEEVQSLPPDGLAGITLLAGHFYAHQLAHPALAGFAPVTVLRDPLARLHSAYRFGRTTAEAGQPLTPAMEYGLRVGFFEYAFSGIAATGARHTQLMVLGLNAGEPHTTVPLGDLLERAKRRLGGMRVGLTEDLAPFLDRLFTEAGAPVPELPRLMAQEPAEEDGLTAAQRATLREVLAPDYALHAHGREAMLRWLEGDPAVAARHRRRRLPENDLVARLKAMPGPVGTLQKLCDAADWADPRLPLVAREAIGLPPRIAPRMWEVCMVFLALALAGALDGAAEGLGLGEGCEPLARAAAARSARFLLADPEAEEAPGGACRRMDLRRLDLAEASLDYCCSVSALQRLGGEADLLAHLREVRRVLRPGGAYVLTTALRLDERSDMTPGNCSFALDHLLRLFREAGLHPERRISLRLSDFAENDPRDLPNLRHHDPAEALGMTLSVTEAGGIVAAPVLFVLRPEPQGEPVVEGLGGTIARARQALAQRVAARFRDWTRLNPWGLWAAPRSAFSDLHATAAEPVPGAEPVFATGYLCFGEGAIEVQVVLAPSPLMPGPAAVQVLVNAWALEDPAALRPCHAGEAVALNDPPGRAATLRFRLPVEAGFRYAILGRAVAGRPLLSAVDVQVRHAP